jgi:hypothetical protein
VKTTVKFADALPKTCGACVINPDQPLPAQLRGRVERNMKAWLERAVIGLNLCPFAKAVHVKGQIHYAISESTTHGAVLEDLAAELDGLVSRSAQERETTLLVVPLCLADFMEFNLLLADANRLVARRRLDGVVQLASFHPRYQFAGVAPDDITNFTNRAPYPTLHLLREAGIARAVEAFPQPEPIYEANMQTLRRLGPDGWAALEVGPR